ncbi:conserved protein of unknown function [Thermococcus camini]|uniref:Angiomotin C-terminal domain-containing protein n=2 Tax=Thermococcus camini TaxID=2016373 RepID=A0A7G2D609_9EURY|nr:conserved protein of unknown function [Thermococcus camini]
MQRPMVDYKWLLLMAAWLYGNDEFDSKTMSEELTEIMFNLTNNPKWIERLQPKLVSNDLRRLYIMGFLRRRKIERKCRNKKGKEYNCGYKYLYQINNQGWKYIGFLLREFMKKEAPFSKQVMDEFREFNEELKDMRIAAWRWLAVKYFEEGKMEAAKSLLANTDDIIERKFEGRGYRRFTERKRLHEEVMKHRVREVEMINTINSLEREVEQKDALIKSLQDELEKCRKELGRLQNFIQTAHHQS